MWWHWKKKSVEKDKKVYKIISEIFQVSFEVLKKPVQKQ